MKMPCSVSRKKNVKASNGRVEPIQEKKFGRRSTLGLNRSAKASRMRELMPSATTTRSASADRRIERRDFRLVLDLHAERARAPAQNLQQRPARAAAEAVAADAVGGAAEMDLDVVPVGKVPDDGAIALAVIALERVERLVGEHHAEAEGIVGPVALEHGDARLRPCLLHQDREIEPGRAAADHVNFHARLHRSRSRPRRAVPIRHPEVPAPWRASKDDGHTRPAPEPSPTEVRLAPRGDGYRA